jgi:hypothetical protein
LLVNAAVLQAVRDGRNYEETERIFAPGLEEFKRRRALYLIYP